MKPPRCEVVGLQKPPFVRDERVAPLLGGRCLIAGRIAG